MIERPSPQLDAPPPRFAPWRVPWSSRFAPWRVPSSPRFAPSLPRSAESGGQPLGSAAGDRGSVVPLLALSMVGVALAVVVIGATTRHAVRTARAQWAADAAALAAASVGPTTTQGAAAARAVAEANGATLSSLSVAPGPSDPLIGGGPSGPGTPVSPVVVVRVDYGGVVVDAAAQRFLVMSP